MKKYWVAISLTGFFLTAFVSSQTHLFEVPKNWPAPQYDFTSNPLTNEKIELGRALFYDPILSKDNTISCASCHSPFHAFTHVDHDLSHGIEDRIGTRNSPALMNLAWSKSFMWDGAIHHLDVQALAPISHPDEMGETIANVVSKLQSSTLYPALFYSAFGDSVITGEHTLKAISQFMLTLVSANSKYDKVMRKEDEFSEQEMNGYTLFKKNCASCHQEPLFTNFEFKNNGLSMDTSLKDFGRMKITGNPDDSLKFKVPTLRNIEFTYPYMHDGRFRKLQDAISHYSSGIQASRTLAGELNPSIVLSPNERVDLLSFLLTLSDPEFIHNKDFSFPKNIFFPSAKE